MRKQKGFSLIELLIVVAIILAIPNLLRARIAANEASAVASIRTINTAEVTYLTAYPTTGYSITLAALGPSAAGVCPVPASTNACLLDFTLASASTTAAAKSGYYFGVANSTTATTPVSGYTVGAAPSAYNSTGVRLFCSIEDGVVRATPGSAAGVPVTATAGCIAYTTL
jgi:prepilin-type N-terminal cleavage/methylation domain-containing protein